MKNTAVLFRSQALRYTHNQRSMHMEWIAQNKDWLFSGIAIAIPLAIIGWWFYNRGNKQIQKGGNNSTNIQVGGNLKIGGNKDDK